MALLTNRCLRLADVLAEDAFALELVSGGPDAPRREVRGAHAVEVEAPARWLGPGWIMLTTGVRLRGNAGAQRGLVSQLEEGGASALGFGVGFGFKRVPSALVEAAQERGFPVFLVRAYFAHDLDIAATAAALHMHRNSLRYRLARAEQVLGRSLKQLATIAAVYIALVAEAGDQSGAPGLDALRLRGVEAPP